MNRWALFVGSAAALACTESVESTDVRTSGIYPEFRVVADGSGNSVASARLKVGGNDSNTFLDLEDGDRVEVTVGSETRTLARANDHRYTASFPVDAAGTEFTFALVRGEADESAPRSVVTLPAPFELTMSVSEASRASDDVPFTWTPPATGELHWDLSGDCVWTEDGATPDDGSYSIARTEVRAHAGDETESCGVQLVVQRNRSGSIDPAFTEGGETVALQQRLRSFTSMP